MGDFLVKAAPDSDLYCMWSTIADAPTWLFDSAADALEHPEVDEERLARARISGTTAQSGVYGWADEAFRIREVTPPDGKLYELPRTNLAAYIDSALNDVDNNESRWHLLRLCAEQPPPGEVWI